MRPTAGTLKRTSVWLTIAQRDDLAETARLVGSNASQIIRDAVNKEIAVRQKQAAKRKTDE